MLNLSIKSVLAAGIVAAGAAFATTSSANAGSNFGVYIHGPYGGGIYYGNKGPGYGHGHVHRHRGVCKPRRALNKAYRMGLNRPHISRIGRNRIVVKGFRYGHRAKVVFGKHRPRCPVIKTRGLY